MLPTRRLIDIASIILKLLETSATLNHKEPKTKAALDLLSKACVTCGLGIVDARPLPAETPPFHSDLRSISINILLTLCNLGFHPAAADLDGFSEHVVPIVQCVGNYSVQSGAMCFLHAYAKYGHSGCKTKLDDLEGRFGKLEPPICLTPSAMAAADEVDSSRMSPRKFLITFNRHYGERSKVLSQCPIAMRAFGTEIKVTSTTAIEWNLTSCDLMYDISADERCELLFERDIKAVEIVAALENTRQQQRWWVNFYVERDYVPAQLDKQENRLSILLDTQEMVAVARRALPLLPEHLATDVLKTCPQILKTRLAN